MHVAAFLNSAGGQVVIGINEDGIITGLKTDGYTAGYLYKKKLHFMKNACRRKRRFKTKRSPP